MQRTRIAAAFALLLVLSTPSFAMQRDRQSPGDEGPIGRIIRFIKHVTQPVVHILDDITIPKP